MLMMYLSMAFYKKSLCNNLPDLKLLISLWSARALYDRRTQALLKMGFVKSKCGLALMVHSQNGSCIYVLIRVDDILIMGSAPHLIQDVISKLNAHFTLKQLGQVDDCKFHSSGDRCLTRCLGQLLFL
jgi:hypothetical protein